ncbi:unnamed protein product [Kluyveromyces dobzhanskii CBS 2104]|uniref:WGS project CCBQ000000000 data, contig 00106 n=1 Tax=Kluyveromyces dobzhanskii CBS 2104 TaxID=1427455 RepID=A0A0A8L7H4_9SACH|nr:unnamed protein product [Kluyveromyces dobzhanskii CBS 2104]
MRLLTVVTLFAATAFAAFENSTSSDVPVPPPSSQNGTSIDDLSTAWITDVETVTEFTTYCPYPTTIVTNDKTIVVTEATTLTITDCPCVLTNSYPGYHTPAPPATEQTTAVDHTTKSSEKEVGGTTSSDSSSSTSTSTSTAKSSVSSTSSRVVQTFDENVGNKVSGGLVGALGCLALLW